MSKAIIRGLMAAAFAAALGLGFASTADADNCKNLQDAQKKACDAKSAACAFPNPACDAAKKACDDATKAATCCATPSAPDCTKKN